MVNSIASQQTKIPSNNNDNLEKKTNTGKIICGGIGGASGALLNTMGVNIIKNQDEFLSTQKVKDALGQQDIQSLTDLVKNDEKLGTTNKGVLMDLIEKHKTDIPKLNDKINKIHENAQIHVEHPKKYLFVITLMFSAAGLTLGAVIDHFRNKGKAEN